MTKLILFAIAAIALAQAPLPSPVNGSGGGASGITIPTTTVTGGTAGAYIYNNAGVVGSGNIFQSSGSIGIGPGNTSPTGTLSVYDATAITGSTNVTVRSGAGQSTDMLTINQVATSDKGLLFTGHGNQGGGAGSGARIILSYNDVGNKQLELGYDPDNPGNGGLVLVNAGLCCSVNAGGGRLNFVQVESVRWNGNVTTVAGLATCDSSRLGSRYEVSDAVSAVPGTTLVGSGTYTIAVQCIFNSTGSAYSWIID